MEQTPAIYRFRQLFDDLSQSAKKTAKEQISQELGIGIPQLNKIIREDTDPGGQQLRVIADYFGLRVDDLFATLPHEELVAA